MKVIFYLKEVGFMKIANIQYDIVPRKMIMQQRVVLKKCLKWQMSSVLVATSAKTVTPDCFLPKAIRLSPSLFESLAFELTKKQNHPKG